MIRTEHLRPGFRSELSTSLWESYPSLSVSFFPIDVGIISVPFISAWVLPEADHETMIQV